MAQLLDAARASHHLVPSSDPAWQVVHLSRPVLRDVEACAERLGQSASWCLRMAWSLADDLESVPPLPRRLRGGTSQAVRVVMPMTTWRAVASAAETLDRSRSWLLGRAWLIARKRMPKAAPAWPATGS